MERNLNDMFMVTYTNGDGENNYMEVSRKYLEDTIHDLYVQNLKNITVKVISDTIETKSMVDIYIGTQKLLKACKEAGIRFSDSMTKLLMANLYDRGYSLKFTDNDLILSFTGKEEYEGSFDELMSILDFFVIVTPIMFHHLDYHLNDGGLDIDNPDDMKFINDNIDLISALYFETNLKDVVVFDSVNMSIHRSTRRNDNCVVI